MGYSNPLKPHFRTHFGEVAKSYLAQQKPLGLIKAMLRLLNGFICQWKFMITAIIY